MPLLPFNGVHPSCSSALFIAPDAWVTGQVTLAAESSIFFCAVLRGDIQAIRVGRGTNIQDHAMLHTSTGMGDCIVGDYVTVGHRAILHGCTVGNNCIIGMGATILDNAVIEDDCIIGANALVTMGTHIAKGSMVLGTPAKVTRKLRTDEIEQIKENALHYIGTARAYARICVSELAQKP